MRDGEARVKDHYKPLVTSLLSPEILSLPCTAVFQRFTCHINNQEKYGSRENQTVVIIVLSCQPEISSFRSYTKM